MFPDQFKSFLLKWLDTRINQVEVPLFHVPANVRKSLLSVIFGIRFLILFSASLSRGQLRQQLRLVHLQPVWHFALQQVGHHNRADRGHPDF